MNNRLERLILKKWHLKVFLCHSHADAAAVHALYTRLKNSGVDAWLDKEKLLAGQNWEHEIRKAILKSDVVIACLSRGFNKQQGFRHEELKIALEKAEFNSRVRDLHHPCPIGSLRHARVPAPPAPRGLVRAGRV